MCGCEVFEIGFSTVEKLLTLLFRESLLISRAPISAGTPSECALPKIYFGFGGINGRSEECGSRFTVSQFAVRGSWPSFVGPISSCTRLAARLKLQIEGAEKSSAASFL